MRKIKKNKFDSLSSVLIAIAGIFTVLCFGTYFVILLIHDEKTTSWILPLFVVLLVIIPILTKEHLKKLLKKLYFPIKICFCCGLLFYMVSFSIFCGFIFTDIDHSIDVIKDESVIMVFGCRTFDYTPSDNLKERLDKAYELLVSNPNTTCIVSGGQGSNETIPEAEAMRAYLESRGIDDRRIIKEDESSSTIENLKYSMIILDDKGLGDKNIIGVSNDFHIPRIQILSDNLEINMTTVAANSKNFLNLFSNVVREYMAYIKMIIFHL